MTYKEIAAVQQYVYNEFKTKYPDWFTLEEIKLITATYKETGLNMDKFNDALTGITCRSGDNGETIIYHVDVYRALVCGIENRNLKPSEWD